jgi:hypothetical protein
MPSFKFRSYCSSGCFQAGICHLSGLMHATTLRAGHRRRSSTRFTEVAV